MSQGRFKNPVEAVLTGIKDIFRKQELEDHYSDNNRLDGKNVLITGANSGLGFGVAVDIAKRGANVYMACRSGIPEKGEEVKQLSGSDKVEMLSVDLSDIEKIHLFCDDIKAKGLQFDVVINNAGVTPPKARKTPQGQDEMFMVNYLAKFIMINRFLLDNSLANRKYGQGRHSDRMIPRVIFVSSDSHQGASEIDWAEFGKFQPYGVKKSISNYSYFKLVLNTLSTEFSKRTQDEQGIDVAIHAMCPGPVDTNIIRDAPPVLKGFMKLIFKVFFRSPEKAAKPVTYMSASPEMEGITNDYLHMFNRKKMDPKTYDPEAGRKLWDASSSLWQQLDPKRAKTISDPS